MLWLQSLAFPVEYCVKQTVDPGFPSSVRGTPALTGQFAGVLPTGCFTQVVAPLKAGGT